MHLPPPRLRPVALKTIILAFALLAGFSLATTARAQISITIAPVPGDETEFNLTWTGLGNDNTGSNIAVFSSNGIPLINDNGEEDVTVSGDLYAGDSDQISVIILTSPNDFQINAEEDVSGLFPVAGSGDFELGDGLTYGEEFNAGTYNVIGRGGMFDNLDLTGSTVTIEAAVIPEPAWTSTLLGIVAVGIVFWGRKKMSQEEQQVI